MGYIAQWGPKGFIVSPEKIITFDGFSTSIELNEDSENDTSGKSPTNTKGIKPLTVNLSITYVRAAGVDPRAQFEEWTSLVGQAYPLYIGGKLFGPEYLKLKKIDLSGVRLNHDGIFLSATVAASFDEYVMPKKTSTGGPAPTPTPTTTTEKKYEPLSERQKEVYRQKTDKLLAQQEEAMLTADERLKEQAKNFGKNIGTIAAEALKKTGLSN